MRGRKITMWHIVYGENWVAEYWNRKHPNANRRDRNTYDERFVDIAEEFTVYDEKFFDMLTLQTMMPYDEVSLDLREQFYKPDKSERHFVVHLAYKYNLTRRQVKRRLRYLDEFNARYMSGRDPKLLPSQEPGGKLPDGREKTNDV